MPAAAGLNIPLLTPGPLKIPPGGEKLSIVKTGSFAQKTVFDGFNEALGRFDFCIVNNVVVITLLPFITLTRVESVPAPEYVIVCGPKPVAVAGVPP